MSRLIVLSNRVKMSDNTPTAGGLAVALGDILTGNSVIWMGWNGEVVEVDDINSNQFTFSKSNTTQHFDNQAIFKDISYMTTSLDSEQYQRFYCGFANSVLWLLLHERPDLINQSADDYVGYQQVNQLFAQQLNNIIEPDDVIWVHDYHFLSVAYYCRQLGMTNRIGLFLHIPFATLSFWQQLEQSPQLIKHLAHYDLLGTQTEQDKTNCLGVLKHYLKDSLLDNSLEKLVYKPPISTSWYKQSSAKSSRSIATKVTVNLTTNALHCLTINAYPISVDVAKIQHQVSTLRPTLLSKPALCSKDNFQTKTLAQQIIAVDRIDYSKGLLERFSVYQSFLQQYPIYQNQLTLLQIACPSRLDLEVYQRHYNEVRQAVNDVNKRFITNRCSDNCLNSHQADSCILQNLHTTNFSSNGFNNSICSCANVINGWQAISYSETVLNHNNLMKTFWHSDIGWVNSLKDGMNLVAKEYIAAQNPDDPGVLLLSKSAGAAEQMQQALIIDPNQPISVIKGLKTALTMSRAERKSRYQTLLQGLEDYDIHAWQQYFLDELYNHPS